MNKIFQVHPPSPSTNPSFTVMLAVFGQFLDHDMTATAISRGTNGSSLSCCPPSDEHPECFAVKVGPGDPVYDVAGSSCMEFVRSAPAAQCKIGPRQQLNQVREHRFVRLRSRPFVFISEVARAQNRWARAFGKDRIE